MPPLVCARPLVCAAPLVTGGAAGPGLRGRTGCKHLVDSAHLVTKAGCAADYTNKVPPVAVTGSLKRCRARVCAACCTMHSDRTRTPKQGGGA